MAIEKVREFLDDKNTGCQIYNIALEDAYVEHGNVEVLKKEIGIDPDSIIERCKLI